MGIDRRIRRLSTGPKVLQVVTMRSSSRFHFLALGLTLLTAAGAAEPAIIGKARAYLGTEAALNAVNSVHYKGTVTTIDAADPSKQSRATIDIIVQKPNQQRIVANSERGVDTTAVDGYEGWQRFQDAANPKNNRLVVMKPDAVKRMHAQAWENLYFYRGLERQGGRIEDRGSVKVDGVDCQKVAFIHPPNVSFVRYFDTATGRLVQTDTDDGGMSREEGERIINGVRFPQRMKMTVKTAKGQTQQITITLDEITVNETFPAAVFRMPSPGSG
jgi:outer membrane lipoprotein-sorting protein